MLAAETDALGTVSSIFDGFTPFMKVPVFVKVDEMMLPAFTISPLFVTASSVFMPAPSVFAKSPLFTTLFVISPLFTIIPSALFVTAEFTVPSLIKEPILSRVPFRMPALYKSALLVKSPVTDAVGTNPSGSVMLTPLEKFPSFVIVFAAIVPLLINKASALFVTEP